MRIKKWMIGIALIIAGVIISFGLSFFIIQAEIYMLNPKYKDMLLISIVGVPTVIYGAGYALWYRRCMAQKSRTQSVYKGELFWMLLIVLAEIGALLSIFSVAGWLDEGSIYYMISCFIPTLLFCCAFLFCKPF